MDKTRKQYLKNRSDIVKYLNTIIKKVKSSKNLEEVSIKVTPKYHPFYTCRANEILQDSLGRKNIGSTINLNIEFGPQVIK